MYGHRRSVRLRYYDYSSVGGYYITLCTNNRLETLSVIRRGDPRGRPEPKLDNDNNPIIELTRLGCICENTVSAIESRYNIIIDSYIIMPDHIHLVVIINDDKYKNKPLSEPRATARVAPTIGSIVGGYKSIVSNEWLKICKSRNIIMGEIWQRNYYEHVIRNVSDLDEIRKYIDNNPIKWLHERGELF
ncbi:MAG: transposase [Eubacteriales bacterium]